MHFLRTSCNALVFLVALPCGELVAQGQDSLRVPRATTPSVMARSAASDSAKVRPPVSGRRAFLYSLAIPGAGQAALKRNFWGGFFFLTEGLSLALVYQNAEGLRLARSFRADSVPESYRLGGDGQPIVGGDGRPVVATWFVSRYSSDRVRARRTHYEDWLAVLIFNHLIAGADAFVAAQLWDLPARVGLQAGPDGRPALAASVKFR